MWPIYRAVLVQQKKRWPQPLSFCKYYEIVRNCRNYEKNGKNNLNKPQKITFKFFCINQNQPPPLSNKYSPGEFPFGLNSSFKPNLNGIFTTGLALCKKCQLIPRRFGFVCYHLAPLLKWRRLTLWLPLLSNRFFSLF